MKSPFSYRTSLHVSIEDVKRIFVRFTDEERESLPIDAFHKLGLVVQLINERLQIRNPVGEPVSEYLARAPTRHVDVTVVSKRQSGWVFQSAGLGLNEVPNLFAPQITFYHGLIATVADVESPAIDRE